MIQQEKIAFTFYTMLNKAKCKSLYDCALRARNLNGEYWDVGCHSGGSSAIMKFAAPERPIRMFDSFDGLPSGSAKDKNNEPGRFAIKFDEIMHMLGPVHAGWVPETFKGLEDSEIALAHVDLDLYQSTKDALEFVGPRIVPGGIIVIDDYGSDGWSGVSQAVDEFLSNDFTVATDAPEQAILTKKQWNTAPVVDCNHWLHSDLNAFGAVFSSRQ